MAITTDQKIDFLWKKIGYKAAKTDLSSVKGGPNEAIPAVARINSSEIWAQSGDIPAVQPTASAGVVTVYSDGGSSSATVECTEDATATSHPKSIILRALAYVFIPKNNVVAGSIVAITLFLAIFLSPNSFDFIK